MMKRYAYFYFMKDEPDRIRNVVPDHIKYWEDQQLSQYLGGPFADRRGGLISFAAPHDKEAELLVLNDPFVKQGLVDSKWVKEWLVERKTTG